MSVTIAISGSIDPHDINFNNRNAQIVLSLIGIDVAGDDGGWCGEIPANQLHKYVRNAIRAMDDVQALRKCEVEGTVTRGLLSATSVQGNVVTLDRVGATWIEQGLTTDQIREKLASLMKLLFVASRLELSVVWY